jgi:hypothetical protein
MSSKTKLRHPLGKLLITTHLKNFRKTNDPHCLAKILDELIIDEHKEAVDEIKKYLRSKKFKKGIEYERQKQLIYAYWCGLQGSDTNTAVRSFMALCFPNFSEEAIRKIIESMEAKSLND